jgi:hypothetical protein
LAAAISGASFDGNETVEGPTVGVTTTAGNQTVTCNLPALPIGARGFELLRERRTYRRRNGFFHHQRPQTWSQLQTFSPGIAIGSETVSASPRSPFTIFFPGALTSTWTGESWTLDKAITVTRLQAQAKTAPAGCTTNSVIRLTDGTTPVNLTIAAAANDSGAITQNYAAGATLTVSVQTAATGCATSPADANAVIQYKMQITRHFVGIAFLFCIL